MGWTVKNIAIVMFVAAALVGCSKEESKSESAAASASAAAASATVAASAAASAVPSASASAAVAATDPPTAEQYEQKAATTITSTTLKAQLDAIDKEVGN
jgi:hypothetical protein